VAIGCDHEGLVVETALAPDQRAALQSDLDAAARG